DHTTWYWAISDQAQIHTDSDTVVMSSSSSAGNVISPGRVKEPQHGFDLSYNRQLGEVKRGSWVPEAAFGFGQIEVRNNQPLLGAVQVLSDSYQLNGTVPIVPLSPGTFAGPGPLIGDIPSRWFSQGPNP